MIICNQCTVKTTNIYFSKKKKKKTNIIADKTESKETNKGFIYIFFEFLCEY